MRPAPLFNNDLPFMRPRIAGFARGDRIEIADPKSKLLVRRGRVMVTLPHFNQVVIHMDDGATVDINPERVRKVNP